MSRLSLSALCFLAFLSSAQAADKFSTFAVPLMGPASSAFAVTKSDSTVFSQPTRAVWVGGAGDLAVRMLDQTTVTFTAVPAGSWLWIRVDKVMSTNTTATNVLGVY